MTIGHLVLVLAPLAACALPNDGIARLRLEPPALELEVDLDLTPAPVGVRVYAQRFDGLEYETSATIAFPAETPAPLGAFDGQAFRPASRAGFATALVTTPEGEVPLAVRVDLVGIARTNLDDSFEPYFASATPIARPSTLVPGDGTIVSRDLAILPFRVKTPANSRLPFELTIAAPFLELRSYGYTTGSDDEIALPLRWADALRDTAAGGTLDVRFRQLAQDLESVEVQRTTVRIADSSLGKSVVITSIDEFGLTRVSLHDLATLRSPFGGPFASLSCETCELEHDPTHGRITVNGRFVSPQAIFAIETPQLVAESDTPWTSSAFAAGGTRLVTAFEGNLVMRDGATTIPLATLDVGGFARDPAVAPDSKRLAWIDLAGDVWIADLDVVAATIASPRILARGSSTRTSNPQFSPDGAWVLYSHGIEQRFEPPFVAGAGFSIVAAAGGTPWRVSDAVTDLEAGWTVPSHEVRAGGEAERVTWLVYTMRAPTGFSGLRLLPIDPLARTTLPSFPIFSSISDARHPPIFDRREPGFGFPE